MNYSLLPFSLKFSKLSYSPLECNKFNKENQLVILDWDDTLFPTNWITNSMGDNVGSKQYTEFYNKNKDTFDDLWDLVKRLIKEIGRVSQIKIVSNGSYEWIKKVPPFFYKGHEKFMRDNNVSINSARDYKNNGYVYSNDQRMWKIITFRDIVKDWKQKRMKNSSVSCLSPLKILSVGDNENDILAVWSLTKDYPLLIKSIKFAHLPTVAMLKHQLDKTRDIINEILLNDEEKKHEFRAVVLDS